jgi:hypothetical protein
VTILKHVDVLDLIKVEVFTPNIYKPGDIQVDLVALEKDKRVVIDDSALKSLNQTLYERCQQFEDARDPKVKEYIKEFVGRMCSEWHRNGLLEIEDIPEGVTDHYEDARRQARELLKR